MRVAVAPPDPSRHLDQVGRVACDVCIVLNNKFLFYRRHRHWSYWSFLGSPEEESPNFQYLDQLGRKFSRLAQMYGGN